MSVIEYTYNVIVLVGNVATIPSGANHIVSIFKPLPIFVVLRNTTVRGQGLHGGGAARDVMPSVLENLQRSAVRSRRAATAAELRQLASHQQVAGHRTRGRAIRELKPQVARFPRGKTVVSSRIAETSAPARKRIVVSYGSLRNVINTLRIRRCVPALAVSAWPPHQRGPAAAPLTALLQRGRKVPRDVIIRVAACKGIGWPPTPDSTSQGCLSQSIKTAEFEPLNSACKSA